MKVVSIIAYVLAAGFIIFAFLFILGAFSPQGNVGWIGSGLVLALIGFALIAAGYFTGRQAKAQQQAEQNVTLNIDLPGNVSLDAMTCQNCGGVLQSKDVTMVAGAPTVNCPYCGTSYQLTEDPKW